MRTDGNEFTVYMVGYSEKQLISYVKKLTKEFKNLPHDKDAAIGFSMIEDDVKLISDAINEATEKMKENKSNTTGRFMKNLSEILQRADMSILPGSLAFSFFLSLVPTLTILFYFAAFLNISISDITSYFNISIDNSLIQLITPVVESTEASFGLLVLLFVGVYLASNGTNSIIVTANNIYNIEQTPFLERRIKAVIMVFIIILLLDELDNQSNWKFRIL